MDWESMWGGISEAVSETWDVVVDVGESVLKDKVLTEKEAARDPDKLRQTEPTKGTNPDGSTIVDRQLTANQLAQPKQWIEGVDNKLVLLGGGIALFLLVSGR
jgi:hypothetical protein